ncbi:MAG TPA: PilZ domain-containing protein [Candidatus Acidoferrales bacterium]|nr:PilZ domain-containing protein [Candidatus Acidoferrales bacterium]
MELDFGPAAGAAIPVALTRAPDGWSIAAARMGQTTLKQRGEALERIVLRHGGQRLETPCAGLRDDGGTLWLGEPQWLRYAQSRTEARLAFDGSRTAHLIFRPDTDQPLSAALMDLSASGVGAFLPYASADALKVYATYPAALHLPSGAVAVRVQVRFVAPMEGAAQWRVGCCFEAPEPPMRSLIRDFLVHARRAQRRSFSDHGPSG